LFLGVFCHLIQTTFSRSIDMQDYPLKDFPLTPRKKTLSCLRFSWPLAEILEGRSDFEADLCPCNWYDFHVFVIRATLESKLATTTDIVLVDGRVTSVTNRGGFAICKKWSKSIINSIWIPIESRAWQTNCECIRHSPFWVDTNRNLNPKPLDIYGWPKICLICAKLDFRHVSDKYCGFRGFARNLHAKCKCGKVGTDLYRRIYMRWRERDR